MTIREVREDYESGQEFVHYFASDMHAEDKKFMSERFKDEMSTAVKRNAKIWLGGDLGRLIMPTDRKRYDKDGDSVNTSAYVNYFVDFLTGILSPYAANIAGIGYGNHEMSTIRYNNVDPLKFVIDRLNLEGADIAWLDYTGFLKFMFNYTHGKDQISITLYHDHGKGGNSPVTKGTIDFNRMFSWVWADLYWMGHKHGKVILPSEPAIMVNAAGNIVEKERKAFLTGCFTANWEDNSSDKYVSLDYGKERMRTAQSHGGVYLTMAPSRNGVKVRIEA